MGSSERGDNSERFLAYVDGREQRRRISAVDWIGVAVSTLLGLLMGGALAVIVLN